MLGRTERTATGTRLGPYRLVARLGGGIDTTLWRAERDGIGVALKVLRDPDDPMARARLAREAAAASRVSHPALLRVVDVGTSFLVLPLLECGTLATVVDDGLVDSRQVAAVGAAIADALAALHGVGVVHRDVSSRNVMLGPDGPVLVDLGAASIDGAVLDGRLDGAVARLTTPRYCAPDTAVTPAVDVWSLGAVLAEALCGSVHPSDEVLARAGVIGTLIAACLDPDPTRRPTARSLAVRLAAAAQGATAPSCAAPIVLDEAPGVGPGTPTRPVVVDSDAGGGRALELARLLGDLDAAAATTELRTTLCVGEVGIGKSWLLRSAAQWAAEHHVVLDAVCTEAVGDLRVLAPWVQRLAVGLDAHRRGVLDGAVGRGVGPTGVGPTGVGLREVADAFATAFALHGPVVAVVDDLHHGDADLLEVLAHLAFRPGVAGVLWCAARPGVVDADDIGAHTMVVGPLADDVIATLCGPDGVAAAAGNPLVAEELARRERSSGPVATLDELLSARVSTLQPATRDALALAATCGEVFWPETLGIAHALDELHRVGVVRAHLHSSVVGSTEVEFTHPRLREVVYASLGARRSADAHVAVASVLETARADVELVAHHLAAAGERAPAGAVERIAARAGWAALDRFSVSAARRWAQLARRSTHEIPSVVVLRAAIAELDGDRSRAVEQASAFTDEPGETGERATLVCVQAHYASGDLTRCVAMARAGLGRVTDGYRRDELAVVLARALCRLDDVVQACDVARDAADDAQRRGSTAGAARLRAVQAIAASELAMRTGDDPHPSTRLAASALQLLEDEGDDRAHAEAACELVEVLSAVDPSTADAVVDPALAAARRAGARGLESVLATTAAHLAFDHGDLERCRTMLARARAGALDEPRRRECDVLEHLAVLGTSGPDAARLRALADVAAAPGLQDPTIAIARLVVPCWFGHLEEVPGTGAVGVEYPHVAAMVECHRRASRGVWEEPDVGALTVAVANELALLAYLRGDRARGDELLVERHVYLAASGSTYQRFNHLYPGALVAALGPAVSAPRVEWLLDEITAPRLPTMWAVHRAMCALVLAERRHGAAARVVASARALLARVQPSDDVTRWLVPRLDAAASSV